MAACTASSSMIFSASCALVFLAFGPAFSNFLNSPSTVLWSFLRSVIASIGITLPLGRFTEPLLGDATLGERQHVEGTIELGVCHQAPLEHDVSDRTTCLGRLLDDLGRRLVPDVRVERRTDRGRRLRVLLALLDVGLDADDALVGQR